MFKPLLRIKDELKTLIWAIKSFKELDDTKNSYDVATQTSENKRIKTDDEKTDKLITLMDGWFNINYNASSSRISERVKHCIDDLDMESEIRENKTIDIFDLSYKTLFKIFNTEVFYDTDKIIVRIKAFREKEIRDALTEQLEYLIKVNNESFEGDSEPLDDRGSILDFLWSLPVVDETDFEDEDMESYIRETMMMEQMRIYGLRELVFCGDERMRKRYFNPNAEIIVEILN